MRNTQIRIRAFRLCNLSSSNSNSNLDLDLEPLFVYITPRPQMEPSKANSACLFCPSGCSLQPPHDSSQFTCRVVL